MPAYALLLRPAANRLYSKGAGALNTAELSVINEYALQGAVHDIGPATIGGVEYVRFASDTELSPEAVTQLSNLSSAFALFQVRGDTDRDAHLIPVTLTPLAHLDDDLLTILRLSLIHI